MNRGDADLRVNELALGTSLIPCVRAVSCFYDCAAALLVYVYMYVCVSVSVCDGAGVLARLSLLDKNVDIVFAALHRVEAGCVCVCDCSWLN